MSLFSLDVFQHDVMEWAKKNFPNEKPHHLLLGIVEEVGELTHAHLKDEIGIRGSKEEHLAEMKDAMGDLFIFAAQYAIRHGFLLSEAIEDTWKEVRKRDWQKFPFDGRTR